uniref:Putative PAS/PAC sensor protein n=1 Tax=Chlorobium chlorochromatii (strain CaD3) TaxID=340177 RepID=Q3AT40_CHLCH
MIKNTPLSNDLALLRAQAEELLTKGQQQLSDPSISPGDMQRILHELAVHQIELEMQQEQLLQARVELEESIECYTELYDFAPLGYVTLSRNGTIQQVNLTATKLLGIERSRLVGDYFGRLIVAEDIKAFQAMLEQVFVQQKHTSCEVKLFNTRQQSTSPLLPSPAHNETLPHTIRIDAVLSTDGEECSVVVSDISMQKQIERENQALKEQLNQTLLPELTPNEITNSEIDDNNAADFNHALLDKVIHSRIRFAILSYLSTAGKASFVTIKRQINTTDGNLSVHLRMLESAAYVSSDREINENKMQTTLYTITEAGNHALQAYKRQLRAFLGL